MDRCKDNTCIDCTCAVQQRGHSVATVPANANFATVTKPKRIIRRDPMQAAEDFKKRFKRSLEILA